MDLEKHPCLVGLTNNENEIEQSKHIIVDAPLIQNESETYL